MRRESLLWAVALLAAVSLNIFLPDRQPRALDHVPVVPCSTDLDCCERNPALCAELDPELYRATWGSK